MLGSISFTTIFFHPFYFIEIVYLLVGILSQDIFVNPLEDITRNTLEIFTPFPVSVLSISASPFLGEITMPKLGLFVLTIIISKSIT